MKSGSVASKSRPKNGSAAGLAMLLAAENVVHEMAEFVKESFHVAIIHQARIGGRGHRKVAHENGFR